METIKLLAERLEVAKYNAKTSQILTEAKVQKAREDLRQARMDAVILRDQHEQEIEDAENQLISAQIKYWRNELDIPESNLLLLEYAERALRALSTNDTEFKHKVTDYAVLATRLKNSVRQMFNGVYSLDLLVIYILCTPDTKDLLQIVPRKYFDFYQKLQAELVRQVELSR